MDPENVIFAAELDTQEMKADAEHAAATENALPAAAREYIPA